MAEMVVKINESATVVGDKNKPVTGDYPCSKKEGKRLIKLEVAEEIKDSKKDDPYAEIKKMNKTKLTKLAKEDLKLEFDKDIKVDPLRELVIAELEKNKK